jgi:hypothetical protein
MTTRRVRKTKLMRDVEERFQRPLERLLPELVNQYGLSQAATEIGVSTSTVPYWMLKLGLAIGGWHLTRKKP